MSDEESNASGEGAVATQNVLAALRIDFGSIGGHIETPLLPAKYRQRPDQDVDEVRLTLISANRLKPFLDYVSLVTIKAENDGPFNTDHPPGEAFTIGVGGFKGGLILDTDTKQRPALSRASLVALSVEDIQGLLETLSGAEDPVDAQAVQGQADDGGQA